MSYTSESVIACVVTFSGNPKGEVLDKIKDVAAESNDLVLVDVSVCLLSNRTLITFAGHPSVISENALRIAKFVFESVEFVKRSDFPSLGILDNCAFVPVREINLQQCHELAIYFASKIHALLDISVYVYETRDAESQSEILRVKAATKKVENSKCLPLFESKNNNSKGATLVWASKGFVNYNVLLFSTKEQAHKIAMDVRDIGRGPNQPGTLKGCQAIGVWDQRNKIAEVATSLQDHVSSSSVHSTYEEILNIATSMKLPLKGSFVLGLISLKVLLDAADFYIKRDDIFVLEEDLKIQLAISKLGLNAKEPFDLDKKVLEYAIPNANRNSLVQKSVTDFIRTVGARVPVPAGGSVAATVAALGAALGTMVGQMTYGRKQWEKFDSQMRRLIPIMHEIMERVVKYVDQDTEAFNEYIAATKLPKDTVDEQNLRNDALQKALVRTIEVPLNLSRSISGAWVAMEELAPIITSGAISDLRVGAWCLRLAVKAAHSSVLENVKGLNDPKYVEDVLVEIEGHLQSSKQGKKTVLDSLAKRHN